MVDFKHFLLCEVDWQKYKKQGFAEGGGSHWKVVQGYAILKNPFFRPHFSFRDPPFQPLFQLQSPTSILFLKKKILHFQTNFLLILTKNIAPETQILAKFRSGNLQFQTKKSVAETIFENLSGTSIQNFVDYLLGVNPLLTFEFTSASTRKCVQSVCRALGFSSIIQSALLFRKEIQLHCMKSKTALQDM